MSQSYMVDAYDGGHVWKQEEHHSSPWTEEQHRIDVLTDLLKRALNTLRKNGMSWPNSPAVTPRCRFCSGRGYDSDSIAHDQDCILEQIREALQQ